MDEAIVQEARSLGWVPSEEFRGDQARWVDADEFVERGRTMLPILRHNNKELEAKLSTSNSKLTELEAKFAASQEAIEALQQFHDEDTKRQVQRAKNALLAELKQAKTDGNLDLEVQLTDELTELNAASRKAAAPETKPVVKQQPVVDPAFAEFAQQNPWFGSDMRKTNRAMGIAQLLRADESNDNLSGRAFFQKVLNELEASENGGTRSFSKVAAGGGSGGNGAGSGGKTYADLPADAKEACAKQGKKLVGEGRAYKDSASWQKKYAELYFRGE